jgi:Flp pilus assembly protein TadG
MHRSRRIPPFLVHRKKRDSSEIRGTSLVEAALVLPVFFLLLLAIFEFGLIMSAYHSMVAAAREGARVAVIPDPNKNYALPSDATIAAVVCDKLRPGVFAASNVDACNGGTVSNAVSCPPFSGKPPALSTQTVYVNRNCTISVPEGGTETYLEVAVHRNIELFWGWQFPLTTRALMRSEAN